MDRYVVDRVEGSTAVLEAEGGGMLDVPLSELPDGTCEGSCLAFDGSAWSLEPGREAERSERIRSKMESLFER